MTGELSGILGHVDRIGKLDLEGVEPTSHVVALENVLRADEPRPSLPQEVGAGLGARPARRRLPRALAAGRRLMAELLELTVAEAAAKIARRRARPRRVRARPGARRAGGDELNAYLWRAEDAERRRGPAGRRSRSRSRTSSAPRACRRPPARGSSRATVPPYTATAVRACARPAPACSARPTWTSSRWAPRTRTPPTGRCSTPGTAAACPAAPRAARRRSSPAASRPARSAPTPAARSASRPRSAGSSG